MVVYVSGDTVADVTSKLQKCLQGVENWYTANKLRVNASKSMVMLLGTVGKLGSIDRTKFNIFYDGQLLETTRKMTYLGLSIDENLSWDGQVANIMRKVAYKITLLRRLSSTLPEEILIQIYKTYIMPLIEYGATVWGFCSKDNLDRAQHLINLTARVIKSNYDFINVRGIDLATQLGWQTFIQRRDYLMASLMYKCVHGLAPNYLINSINLVSEVSERVTRSSASLKIYLPRPNTEKFKSSFNYAGGAIWNNLDSTVQEAPSVASFKSGYKRKYWNNLAI